MGELDPVNAVAQIQVPHGHQVSTQHHQHKQKLLQAAPQQCAGCRLSSRCINVRGLLTDQFPDISDNVPM